LTLSDCPKCRADHANCQHLDMALDYDNLIPGSTTVEMIFWPGSARSFDTGVLSALYGKVNADDLFDVCRLRANHSAQFGGEEWSFDITTTGLTLHGHANVDQFCEIARSILRATKEHLGPKIARALVTDEVRTNAVIPDDKERDVGMVVRRQLLTRIKDEHYAHLPGEVEGAGLRLVGESHDYSWQVSVAPSLARSGDLYISADLGFLYPERPPVKDDLDLFDGDVKITNEFLQGNVVEFAKSLLK
jgi:hypothetical protein